MFTCVESNIFTSSWKCCAAVLAFTTIPLFVVDKRTCSVSWTQPAEVYLSGLGGLAGLGGGMLPCRGANRCSAALLLVVCAAPTRGRTRSRMRLPRCLSWLSGSRRDDSWWAGRRSNTCKLLLCLSCFPADCGVDEGWLVPLGLDGPTRKWWLGWRIAVGVTHLEPYYVF